jgi:uncharacterized membrane protein
MNAVRLAVLSPGGKEAIVGTDSCWQRGFQKVRFMEVDTKEQARWTLFLKQPDSG